MPRGGGRGGGGGGRGARPKAGTVRIGGIDLANEDVGDESPQGIDVKPGELFPPRARDLKLGKKLTHDELDAIKTYRSLRERIHEGPLYAVLDNTNRVKKESSFGIRSTAVIVPDPFESGVETYSLRYVKKKRRLPKLDEGSYELKFFPVELHPILDSSVKPLARPRKRPRKPDLDLALNAGDGITDADGDAEKPTADGADEDGVEADDDEAAMRAPVEDTFEEDEDDVADDYNAEQYFDDGGDDAGDDYDAGGGGGGEGDDGNY